MVSRLATLSFSLVAVVGMLHASVVPAAACSCAVVSDDEGVRGIMDYYGLVVEGTLAPYESSDDLIRIQPEIVYWGELPDEIVVDQPWNLAGDEDGGTGYSSISPSCRYMLMGAPGDRYVLFLEPNPVRIADSVVGGIKGTYYPAGCPSFAIGELEGPNAWADRVAEYEAIKRVSGGGQIVEAPHMPAELPTETPTYEVYMSDVEQGNDLDDSSPQAEAESKDLPWVPILIIALAIPTAVLVIPSFFGKRGPGGH
ncbi:MAG: hypothetical protein ABIU97_10215 [Dehalococcoidia bacterium]